MAVGAWRGSLIGTKSGVRETRECCLRQYGLQVAKDEFQIFWRIVEGVDKLNIMGVVRSIVGSTHQLSDRSSLSLDHTTIVYGL